MRHTENGSRMPLETPHTILRLTFINNASIKHTKFYLFYISKRIKWNVLCIAFLPIV